MKRTCSECIQNSYTMTLREGCCLLSLRLARRDNMTANTAKRTKISDSFTWLKEREAEREKERQVGQGTAPAKLPEKWGDHKIRTH